MKNLKQRIPAKLKGSKKVLVLASVITAWGIFVGISPIGDRFGLVDTGKCSGDGGCCAEAGSSPDEVHLREQFTYFMDNYTGQCEMPESDFTDIIEPAITQFINGTSDTYEEAVAIFGDGGYYGQFGGALCSCDFFQYNAENSGKYVCRLMQSVNTAFEGNSCDPVFPGIPSLPDIANPDYVATYLFCEDMEDYPLYGNFDYFPEDRCLIGDLPPTYPPLTGVSCEGDVDQRIDPATGRGQVDTDDFLLVLASWGDCPCCFADTDKDGDVDADDFLNVLGNWGECPAQ